jgi:hypothetical protein
MAISFENTNALNHIRLRTNETTMERIALCIIVYTLQSPNNIWSDKMKGKEEGEISLLQIIFHDLGNISANITSVFFTTVYISDR